MIYGERVDASWRNRTRNVARNVAGGLIRRAWDASADLGSIGPGSPRARRFGSFGPDSVICFPYAPHVNEGHIHLGASTMVGPLVTLSAGWGPGHPGLPPEVVRLGDRCLIGRGSSIIGHESIVLGDDVWTGYDVRITDMNHGYEDLDRPIAQQHMAPQPVSIGDGTWLGHHVVVLPGVTIGRHVTVGAGSVVTRDLPDHSVAVGVPAKVVRRWSPDEGWDRSGVLGPGWQAGVDAALATMPVVPSPATATPPPRDPDVVVG
jgi:carbonic anhydrase/acetyltransferase-like protein (isoleucine patch superfamily)